MKRWNVLWLENYSVLQNILLYVIKVSTPPTIKVTFYCYQLELAKTVTGLYT